MERLGELLGTLSVDRKDNMACTRAPQHPASFLTGLTGLAISFFLAFGAAPQIVHAQEAPVQLSIAAQPLGEALIQLANFFSLELAYAPALVQGLGAPAVSGNLTADQALNRLLAGTGIEFKRSRNRVSLSRPAADSATQLAPVVVRGSLDPTSEGTGSYAAEAVTIGKGTLTLKEIPQSVSVVTQKQIQDQGLTSIADALRQTTGVWAGGTNDAEFPIIRGFASSKQYDGITLMTDSSRLFNHYDLAMYDRVEILRGPSGLLSGKGEPGGTINYVAKRPKEKFGISGALSTGSWDHYRGELDVTGPLNEAGTLRGRGVMALQDEHKFYDVAKSNHQFLYGILEYDLTPRTTVGLSATYIKRKFTDDFFGIPLYSDGGAPPRKSYAGMDTPSHLDSTGASLDLEHRFDNEWKLKAAYQYRESDASTFDSYIENNGVDRLTGLANTVIGNTKSDAKWNGADISISGPLELLGRKHILTLGYDYASQEGSQRTKRRTLANWDIFNNHDYSDYISDLDASTSPTENQYRYTHSGLYASGRIKLADSFTVVLGGRWTDYRAKTRTVPTNNEWTSGAKADREFTPYGGLIWDLNESFTWYASYADTFVPQTQTDYTGKILDARVGWQAETGIKATFFDGKLNASLSVFRIRDTNRPTIDPEHVGCGATGTSTCYLASGLIQSQGWEAEISGSPAPGWDIIAGYTYNQAKYLSDITPANEGTRYSTNYTPVHLFKLWTQYKFGPTVMDGALRGWTVGAGVYAQSDVYGSRTLTEARQGGYATVDFKLGYRINKNWDAMLYVENVFDREYLSTLSNSLMFNHFYGRPRNAMLTLRGSF